MVAEGAFHFTRSGDSVRGGALVSDLPRGLPGLDLFHDLVCPYASRRTGTTWKPGAPNAACSDRLKAHTPTWVATP